MINKSDGRITIGEWLQIECTVCGKLHGQCDPDVHPAWKMWDGCYTHELPADTPLTVKFKAIISPNLKIRVRKAADAVI